MVARNKYNVRMNRHVFMWAVANTIQYTAQCFDQIHNRHYYDSKTITSSRHDIDDKLFAKQ